MAENASITELERIQAADPAGARLVRSLLPLPIEMHGLHHQIACQCALYLGLAALCSPAFSAPPNQPAARGGVAIYDSDVTHLWNRLHHAHWVRRGPDGKEYGHDRLDPYLWHETKHLLEGDSHQRAIEVLEEFLTKQGGKLVEDPVKRAILQRDLWAVFDWTTERSERKHAATSRELQSRLVKVMQRLALTSKQIHELSDNYSAAAASREFAEQHDPDHPARAFLPPDLLQTDGPWVEVAIDNSSAVTATRHVFDFGARSAFRVFLRLPEGRNATLEYLKRLNNFPRRWLGREDKKGDVLQLNPDLPQFPAGTQVALVRQMMLIDQEGELAATPLIESVQLRIFAKLDKQEFYEFNLSRAALFANKAGGLRPVSRDEKDFRTQLLVHTYDEFERPDIEDLEKHMGQNMRSCLGCHDQPGIFSVTSYVGGNYPRTRYYLPHLSPGRGQEQARLAAQKKREQYSWGLLRGLWEQQPRR